MGNIKVAMKASNRSVLSIAIGLVWLMGSWVPPAAASDRPDTKFASALTPATHPVVTTNLHLRRYVARFLEA